MIAHDRKKACTTALFVIFLLFVINQSGFGVDKVLELRSREWAEKANFPPYPSAILTIACSSDGSRVAIGTRPLERLDNESIYDFVGPLWGKVVTLARTGGGHFSLLKSLPCSAQLNDEDCGGNPTDLFLLGRNDLVAVLDRGGLEPRSVVEFRKADSGQLIRRLLPPGDFESGVCFSAESRLIAWGCRGGRVRVCSFPGSEEIRVFTSETGHSERIDFSADGKGLAIQTSGYSDAHGLYRLHNIDRALVTTTLAGGSSSRTSIRAFSPDGKSFANVDVSRNVDLWDLGTTKRREMTSMKNQLRFCLIFSPDGKLLICGGAVHQPDAVSPVRKAFGLSAPSRRSPGKYLAEIEVWDVQTGKLIDEIRDSRLGAVSSFAFLNDRKTLIAGDLDGNVWFLDYRQSAKAFAPASKGKTSG